MRNTFALDGVFLARETLSPSSVVTLKIPGYGWEEERAVLG